MPFIDCPRCGAKKLNQPNNSLMEYECEECGCKFGIETTIFDDDHEFGF